MALLAHIFQVNYVLPVVRGVMIDLNNDLLFDSQSPTVLPVSDPQLPVKLAVPSKENKSWLHSVICALALIGGT